MGLMVTKKTPEIPKPQSNNGGRRDFLQRPVSNQKVNRRCYICHSPNHISTTCPERNGKTPVRNTPRENTCQAESIAVLLSSRPGLGLEDPRGHHLEVLALALASEGQALALALVVQVLALTLALNKRSWPWPWIEAKAKTFLRLEIRKLLVYEES